MQKEICFGGNRKLKIYGTLHCKLGKRMKKENRVYFESINEYNRMEKRPNYNLRKTDSYQTKSSLVWRHRF